MKRIKLGATGEYPAGKLNVDDEGGLQFAISHTDNGEVRIDFGTPVAWLSMTAAQARSFGEVLIAKAKLTERGRQ